VYIVSSLGIFGTIYIIVKGMKARLLIRFYDYLSGASARKARHRNTMGKKNW